MKKLIPFFIIIILLYSYALAFSAETNLNSTPKNDFLPFINTAISASSGLSLLPGAIYTHRIAKKFSLGGIFKYDYNLCFGDSYLLGFGVVKFSSLYLGAGLSYRLTDGTSKDKNYYLLVPDKRLLPALTGGFIFRPFKISTNRLGLNCGIDIFISSTPLKNESGDNENLLATPLATIIAGGIEAILNSFKINFGIYYRFNL